MPKSKEQDTIQTSNSGKKEKRIVPTTVKNGQLVADDQSPDNGVKQ